MTDWRHRANGLALLAFAVLVVALVVLQNPGALGVATLGLVAFGVLTMLLGLSWLFVAGGSE